MELRECSVFIKRQLIVSLSPATSTVDLCLYKLCSPSVGVTFVNTNLAKWEILIQKQMIRSSFSKALASSWLIRFPFKLEEHNKRDVSESKAVTVAHLLFFQGFGAEVCNATWAACFSTGNGC